MSDADETPETTAEPVKVKQVAIAAGIVTAALTAAVAFTVAGPLGVGIAAAGVAGTGYAAHRVRNPGKGTLLHSWLTRTRRTRTTSTKGSLTWPFTGNQSRRALSKNGGTGSNRSAPKTRGFPGIRSGSAGRKATSGSRTGGSRGSLLPKTTRSRAAAGAGGVLPKHRASRPVPSRTKRGTASSAGKPAGTRAPKTASRTPAKLSKSRPAFTTSARRGSHGLTPKGLASRTRKGQPLLGRRGSGAGGLSGRRSSLVPKATTGRKTSPTRGRSSTTGRGHGRWNPFLGTRGGRNLGGHSTRTRRAGRLGGTLGATTPRRGALGRLRHRVAPDRNRNTAPNRTSLRPRPYVRRSTGQLLRTGLRVPKRQRGTYGSRKGWRPYTRPSLTQAKRARRTLRLRSGVWLRRGAVWVAKTPARRWDRLWDRLPKAPLPLTHYTERAGMKVPSGPKATPEPVRPAASPVTPAAVRDITLMPINHKGETVYVSTPTEVIVDAFQQLAAFQPESAREVEQFLEQQQEMLNQIGQSYGVLSDRMRDGMPFAAPVADSVREIGVALASVGGIAQSAHQTLRVAHEADIRRYEDPRPGEDMWNPEKNR